MEKKKNKDKDFLKVLSTIQELGKSEIENSISDKNIESK